MCRWCVYMGPEIPLERLMERPTHSVIDMASTHFLPGIKCASLFDVLNMKVGVKAFFPTLVFVIAVFMFATVDECDRECRRLWLRLVPVIHGLRRCSCTIEPSFAGGG